MACHPSQLPLVKLWSVSIGRHHGLALVGTWMTLTFRSRAWIHLSAALGHSGMQMASAGTENSAITPHHCKVFGTEYPNW